MFSFTYGKNAIQVLVDAIGEAEPEPLISKGFLGRFNLQNRNQEDLPLDPKNTEKLLNIPSHREQIIYDPDQTNVPNVFSFKQKSDSPGQLLLFNKIQSKLHEDIQAIDTLFLEKEIF